MPGQVADALRGQTFSNWDHFRQEFWKAVSEFPALREHFNLDNQSKMAQGKSPFALESQQLPGKMRYEIHHMDPIHNGGGVYDLDNLTITSPLFHSQILDPSFHYKY